MLRPKPESKIFGISTYTPLRTLKIELFIEGPPVLFFGRDIVHRHKANYLHVVHVDYDDYFRFGRVEKQLDN